MQKSLKRHLKECKNVMLPHEYLIELHGKVSSKDFLDEFRDFMHKGSVDKYQFLWACHIEMTAEECVREIVLCCSLNETFTVLVRFSTDIIHPLNDQQARIEYTKGSGDHFYPFHEKFILVVMQSRTTMSQFSDVYNDERFPFVVTRYLRWARRGLTSEEYRAKCISLNVLEDGDLTNRLQLFHQGDDSEQRRFKRRPHSEVAENLFQRYFIDVQYAFMRGDDPGEVYTPVLQQFRFLLYGMLTDLEISSKSDIERLSNDQLSRLASCLNPIRKLEFLKSCFYGECSC